MHTPASRCAYIPPPCRGLLQIAVDHQYRLYLRDLSRDKDENFAIWLRRQGQRYWMPKVIDGGKARI